jgi:DNA-binding response OmpR family regulator
MQTPAPTILLLEDHPATRTFLADNLTADGYELLTADTALAGRELLESSSPDLAIVDLTLPDGDGLAILSTVRQADRATGRINPDLPLLVLSGRAGELDRVRGFERGCDDYLTKPFSYHELRARVQALLRRSLRRPMGSGRMQIGPLEIDPLARLAWLDGEPVPLSKKEFGLLHALAIEPTRVCTRTELLKKVWGFRVVVPTRTLDAHAFRLRHKLARNGHRFVINVWGVGYRLTDGLGE